MRNIKIQFAASENKLHCNINLLRNIFNIYICSFCTIIVSIKFGYCVKNKIDFQILYFHLKLGTTFYNFGMYNEIKSNHKPNKSITEKNCSNKIPSLKKNCWLQ